MTSCGRACGDQARMQKNQFGLVEEEKEKVEMAGAVYLIGRASQDRAKETRSAFTECTHRFTPYSV